MLANGPFLSLGAMSYSLYLWHWPLLIFWLAYTRQPHAGLLDGTAVLLISGALAWLTTKYVENPLRRPSGQSSARRTEAPKIPLRVRLKRPTIVLGSIVALLGVSLTATAFTWREHMAMERANGKELATLSPQDYPGARVLLNPHLKAPVLPFRPTVLEAKDDVSTTCPSATAPTAIRMPRAPLPWPAVHMPSTGSLRWICWASVAISRSSPI
jgi:hypothetical protein